ncbi:hypothetical protein DFH06DRAFT_992702 [Mycena polygramma]|nr:hypothetical protein C8R47DRAFT_965669 [Mycena vitilis]KAJ7654938.1 hypothetical protein DFH06DRAFT_992702 [Mycena polygramma]
MPHSNPDSLDDVSSQASYGSDEDFRLAQQEWEESLHQLQQLVSIVLLPVVGRWLGRRWSQWLYSRYLKVGLSKSFLWG